MKAFLLFYPLLKEGKIPPLSKLEEAVKNFQILNPKEQVALIVFGRKLPRVREILKKWLPFEEDIKACLLENEIIEVTVPVVDTNIRKGQVSKVYIIKGASRIWTNLGEYQSVLESKIKPLIGKDFITLFEEKFEGYSFLLPLAVALIKPELLERFCFSGNLEADGKLIPVSGVKEKKEACRTLGKTLITSNDFENLNQLLDYLEEKPKPIPLFIATKNRPEEVLKKNFQLMKANIKNPPKEEFEERILNSSPYKDLGLLERPDDWKKALSTFEEWVKKIDATFEDASLHIALDGPAPLAFAYGIMHGAHKNAVFYHFQGGRYLPLVKIDEKNSRALKVFVENPKLVEAKFFPCKEENKTKTLAVVLDMASHPIAPKVFQFLEEETIKADKLVLNHREKGGINTERLWTEDIAETFSLIRKYYSEKPYEEILFFFGTPVAFAFGLGAAFGHYAKGAIYSFYRDRKPPYAEVLRLEEIKKIR